MDNGRPGLVVQAIWAFEPHSATGILDAPIGDLVH